MDTLRLVLLKCSQCGAPLAAEGSDVVYYCTACRSGFRLEGEGEGERLVPVTVEFVSAPHVAASRYLPFWLLPAKVTIQQRDAAGGAIQGLMRLFTGGGEEGLGQGEVRFAIPAFRAPIDTITELALRYTEALPHLGEKLGEKLTGGTLSPEDAGKLAHFTLIAAEAAKPDTLKNLAYHIDLGPPSLLGVPFVEKEGRLVDGVFGVEASRLT